MFSGTSSALLDSRRIFTFFLVFLSFSLISIMSSESCCPPNAYGYLAPDYKTIGNVKCTSEGTEFYSVGEENIVKTKRAIFLNPDIFGWNGGRTRNIADYFSTHDYYVVIPKLLTPAVNGGTDGDGFADRKDINMEIVRERWDWPQLAPKVNSLTNYLKSVGIEKIYLLGFCWGGWVGTYMVSSPGHENFVCQAIGHPSVHLEERVFQRSTQHLFDSIQVPTLLLPTRGDPDGYREQGSLYHSVKHHFPSSKTIDYPEQDHGFIPRADISIEVNKIAVENALENILDFFAAHQ